MGGAWIDRTSAWEVRGGALKGAVAFLRALPLLAPDGWVLALGDGHPPPALAAYLSNHAVEPDRWRELEPAWPWRRAVHVPIEERHLLRLADFAENLAEPELCIHLAVYDEQEVLFGWHDAFDDPLLVSKRIAEADLRRFCAELGCEYCNARDGEPSGDGSGSVGPPPPIRM